ncbi:MAG: DNA polymerase III subunit delta [Desulfovibrionales bacterium]
MRPGFSFYVCPDSRILKKRIQQDIERTGTVWHNQVFWADEILPSAYWEALTLPGLFGDSRVVILRKAEHLKTEDWAKFVPILNRFSTHIWPIFCLEGEWNRNQPAIPAALSKQKFWKVAQEKSWTWTSPGLTPRDIPGILKQWAAGHGLTFPPGVLDIFARTLPLDGSALSAELEKIRLSLQGRTTLDPKDLQHVTFHQEVDIFAFLDAMVRAKAPFDVWQKVLASQVGSDSNLIFPFLSLLMRESRILWQLAVGDEDHVRLPPSIKSSKRELARNLGLEKLSRIWDLGLESESGIKSGRFSPDQALEYLVSSLSLLLRTP